MLEVALSRLEGPTEEGIGGGEGEEVRSNHPLSRQESLLPRSSGGTHGTLFCFSRLRNMAGYPCAGCRRRLEKEERRGELHDFTTYYL